MHAWTLETNKTPEVMLSQLWFSRKRNLILRSRGVTKAISNEEKVELKNIGARQPKTWPKDHRAGQAWPDTRAVCWGQHQQLQSVLDIEYLCNFNHYVTSLPLCIENLWIFQMGFGEKRFPVQDLWAFAWKLQASSYGFVTRLMLLEIFRNCKSFWRAS